jgi:hypothetical protein
VVTGGRVGVVTPGTGRFGVVTGGSVGVGTGRLGVVTGRFGSGGIWAELADDHVEAMITAPITATANRVHRILVKGV